MKQIKIQCHTGNSLPLDAFIEFQGDLKELSKENYQKLKKEIEKTGFAFAPHVWKSKKNNKIAFYLIDGHQRIRTLRQMVKEGYECGEIPVVIVEAGSMKEAKRRVLQGTSQYGKMTDDGLYEFVSLSEIDFEDALYSFRLADIDINHFQKKYFENNNENIDDKNLLQHENNSLLIKWVLGSNILLCNEKDASEWCAMIDLWQKITNKEAVREDGVKFNALLLQD